MYRSNRIISLNERYKELLDDSLYVNCVSNCLNKVSQKRMSNYFNSVLESSLNLESYIKKKISFLPRSLLRKIGEE